MSDMVRKQLYITKSQELYLKEKAKELGVTEAELVRDALDLQLKCIGFVKDPLSVWEEESAFINSLMGKGDLQGKRDWKRDDLYER
ncbi:MAG: hypothetical protein KGZ63_11315 [Clostridiales bacterium]|nr:hypothetical protein [Clostridiales bacterium]MBS4031991.1 hypothetical protein [Clostridiales bacterium]